MGRFNTFTNVGLRDRVTRNLIAVYPEEVCGSDEEVYDKVISWYKDQDYARNDEIRSYYVDTITDDEFKSMKK